MITPMTVEKRIARGLNIETYRGPALIRHHNNKVVRKAAPITACRSKNDNYILKSPGETST